MNVPIPAEATAPDTPIEAVLDQLDELATQWQVDLAAEEGWECRRDKVRRPFRLPCHIWYFQDCGTTIRQGPARTRNLSERGIGLIARSMVLKGVPIEIRVDVAGRPTVFLGGVVAFCRHTSGSYHEIGVELKAHQRLPIFHDDAIGKAARVPWLQDALRSLALRVRSAASNMGSP